MFNVADLGLDKIDSGIVIQDVNTSSAVLGAGTNVGSIPLGGLSFPRLGALEAFAVEEGEAKTASGEADSITMDARKLAVASVFTEEVMAEKQPVVDAAWKAMPGAVANKVDLIVDGLVAKPAKWTSDVFGAPTMEIGTGADASVDLDDVRAAVATGDADVFLLTSAMLAYLNKQRFTSGGRVFEIVKESKNSGTIDGVSYRVIKSNVAKGVAIDSSRLFVSITPFNDPKTGSPYRIKDAGTITDTNGVTHNLTSENKYAVIYEVHAGVAFDATEFPVFGPAPVAP